MNPLDPVIFPRAAAYLASVPGGLLAYPDCTARTDVGRIILAEFPKLLELGVAADFRKQLVDTVRGAEKLPDAWSVLMRLMLRGRGLRDDGAFIAWHLGMSARVFTTPLYRVLMHVLSPSLVLAGAQRRWNAFRTGTNLASDGDKTGATLTLAYPRLLYPQLVARAYAESFRAALQAARAEDVHIELTAHGDTEARYRLGWR